MPGRLRRSHGNTDVIVGHTDRNIEAIAKALVKRGARLLMMGVLKIIDGISTCKSQGNREYTLASLYEDHDLKLS